MRFYTFAFVLILSSFCTFVQAQAPSDLKELSFVELDSFIDIYIDGRQHQLGLLYAEAAQENALNNFGEQDSIYAQYNNVCSFFHSELGAYDKALSLRLKAKKIFKALFGEEHRSYVSTLSELGIVLYQMGNYKEAIEASTKSIELEKKLENFNPIDLAVSINGLAIMHQNMGNNDKALQLYHQAKKIKEQYIGKEHPSYAVTLMSMALLYQYLGSYDQALPLMLQSRSILEQQLGEEHSYIPIVLGNLANLYQLMEKDDLALPLLLKAKVLDEKILGPHHPDMSYSLLNLSSFYQKIKNFDAALPFAKQALEIDRKTIGEEHPHYAISLTDLAQVYFNLKDYERSLALLLEAIEIRSNKLSSNHPHLVTSYEFLGQHYNKLQKKDLAMQSFIRALSIGSGLEIGAHISQEWADSLANAPYRSKEHIKKTIKCLNSVYLFIEEHTDDKQQLSYIAALATSLLTTLQNKNISDKDKLRMLSESSDWLVKSLSLLDPAKDISKAFELVDQNKSVLLLEATKSEKTYQLGNLPDSLIEEDQQLLQQRDQLEAQLQQKRSLTQKDSLLELLNGTNEAIQSFKQTIETQFPAYAKLKYQQQKTKVVDIQKRLDKKTALIEYMIEDETVHIFCITKNEAKWVKQNIDSETLRKKIKELHFALSNYSAIVNEEKKSYENYTQLAHWFHQQLIAPVINKNKTLENLIIVTDGKLGHLPFGIFLVETAKQKKSDYKNLHYLLNDFNITYNYSASLWGENMERPAPQNNGQILGMASNYNLKTDSSIIDLRMPTDLWLRDALNPLPAARKEIDTLQKKFNGFFAFDELASEKTIKKIAHDYAIIHLAMHGILDAKRPVLSSLAFSEDNDSLENNFWQAHEISKMKLHADLVVLSACETGYGKFEKGNGIASLARAFMYAGASSMIVSLWQVNDFATAKIMNNLYENLANGMPKDQALRQAKLHYLQSSKGIFTHPAFWSPFILIGNTQSIHISKKSSFPFWPLGIGLLSCLGVGFVFYKRKGKAA